MKHIMRCQSCNSYTMKEVCGKCNVKTVSPKPAKYSPEDPYGDYRRKARRQSLVEKGML